ncbi:MULTISPECIES: peroxiredoxin [Bradyrhizobium]|uniref:peroxiredoxin n=1 Tax=Bradyrhizobium TaxID=374 RepID=UPI00155EC740|nr:MULTISPECIES: peroxiredoxin [Bradyrhizobium]MDD1520848.1 bacterioferritin [Bradyrhizobium sp. WBAH30]MDD1546495.1 bacterioferritin [Bradyrhizobium sp. WBAH41]MDD1560189.1 bacterioferritin [Bradyrhizobium sp. WBAH23]MDD1567754.1 bacterioferritin [Bradyrhizobium sp. WBAH33]MDD1592431.1 bacterioferritin [Bradyrhizobium sp. WBAH42]
MSKKSRKKSSKTPSGSPTAKKKTAKTRASLQTRSAKTQRTPARKSAATIAKAGSHKAASKQLKSSKSASSPAAAKSGLKSGLKPGLKSGLAEGQKAPAFSLPRDGGDVVTLADYAGQKLVLFFYPRADTPGCTREAIDFTRLADAFAAAGTAVLGISADPLKAQEKFRDKHKLGIPLISDETHQMLEAYGAWGEKSMYGKSFLGILRTTILVGTDGKVARIWRNVRVDGHADQVLEAARSL